MSELRTYIEAVLNEKRFAKSQVMYHGTTSKFIPSILTNGLEAEPDKAVYSRDDDDDDDSWYRDEFEDRTRLDGKPIQTIGGVYMSQNAGDTFAYASNATEAFGGQQTIIQLQITEKSTFLDEDVISQGVLGFARDAYTEATNAETVTHAVAELLSADDETNINNNAAQIFITQLEKEHGDIVKSNSEKETLERLCYAAFMIHIGMGSLGEDEFISTFIKNGKDKGDGEIAFNRLEDDRDYSHDSDWYSGLDFLTRRIKSSGGTRRSTQDIGFRGRNKITCIIVFVDADIDEDEDAEVPDFLDDEEEEDYYANKAYVVYGKPSDDLSELAGEYNRKIIDYRGKGKELAKSL